VRYNVACSSIVAGNQNPPWVYKKNWEYFSLSDCDKGKLQWRI